MTNEPMTFVDRHDAGEKLAQALLAYRDTDAVVVGLARGGVTVGEAVALALNLSLVSLVVRKLGAPQNPELAIGAVSETGVRWLDRQMVSATHSSQKHIQHEIETQVAEARRRRLEYSVAQSLDTVQAKIAIVVDDGIATGATALVAIQSARDLGATSVVVATPVASSQSVHLLEQQADRVVVLAVPEPFMAVGMHYKRFDQVSDQEVTEALRSANRGRDTLTSSVNSTEFAVDVSVGSLQLPGTLGVPDAAWGLVIFAHGSGSGKFSPRNNAVARFLQTSGLATLLLDLLTEPEARNRQCVFDIQLLAQRLQAATDWATQQASTQSLPIGYFGASTGAGAALIAAAARHTLISAIVSRGGRPDLAGAALSEVQAPTLLIVGGADTSVIELNQQAMAQMSCITELSIIPGATHLFEEPGTLEEVSRLARNWFVAHMRRSQ